MLQLKCYVTMDVVLFVSVLQCTCTCLLPNGLGRLVHFWDDISQPLFDLSVDCKLQNSTHLLSSRLTGQGVISYNTWKAERVENEKEEDKGKGLQNNIVAERVVHPQIYHKQMCVKVAVVPVIREGLSMVPSVLQQEKQWHQNQSQAFQSLMLTGQMLGQRQAGVTKEASHTEVENTGMVLREMTSLQENRGEATVMTLSDMGRGTIHKEMKGIVLVTLQATTQERRRIIGQAGTVHLPTSRRVRALAGVHMKVATIVTFLATVVAAAGTNTGAGTEVAGEVGEVATGSLISNTMEKIQVKALPPQAWVSFIMECHNWTVTLLLCDIIDIITVIFFMNCCKLCFPFSFRFESVGELENMLLCMLDM